MHKTGDPSILAEIQERLQRAKRYDTYIVSLCPFHEDHNPSFFVYADWYSCKSCNAQGKPERLLKILERRLFPDSEEKPVNPWHDWTEEKTPLEVCKEAYRNGQGWFELLRYIMDRGINLETIQKRKIGWMEGWITIPFFQRNYFIGAQARNIKVRKNELRYASPSNQGTVLYDLSFGDTAFLVFGVFDCLTLHQMGYSAITTTAGITKNPEQFRNIIKRMMVIPDNQENERKKAHALVANLGWRGTIADFEYPDGCKDINDFFLHDPKALKAELEKNLT